SPARWRGRTQRPQATAHSLRGTPLEYAVSANVSRRNLSKSQRAALAVLIEPRLAREARERQREHGGTAPGRPKEETPQEDAPEVPAGEARDRAAALCGCSGRYVGEARRLHAEAPDLFAAVLSGQLLIPQAMRLLKKRDKSDDNNDKRGQTSS